MFTILIAALALSLLQPAREIPASTLTPVQIAVAIARGAEKDKRVRVGKRATLIKSALAAEVGEVFTAERRIAAAARTAAASYQPFTPADVTPELGGDYVLFVLTPQLRKDSAVIKTAPETVLVLPKGSTDPSKAIRPLWTSDSVDTLQNLFGATWTEKTVFAAFPRSAIGKDVELVVVYAEELVMGSGASKREIRAVVVDAVQ